MAERRQHRRFKKQYTVRFGTTDLSKQGVTGDISKGGAFILTRDLVPLDTRVHLQVQLDPKNFVLFEGIVQRHRKVPPELRQVDAGGFGVRFLYPGEVVADIVHQDTTTFELHYASAEELQAAYKRELRAGGIFIPTEKPLRIQDKVIVSFCLDFANATVEQESSVVHIALPGNTRAGVSVVFTDKKALEEQLKPFLPAPEK
ncbi:PilZ domain-containing protein [Hyalangium versicolor]|uniref:PilZ domain-containing protein n=1 Tax=Hyalangium versicolor TaxID=2861190 RepID=UPI001CCFD93E|nr:PilZ domain-containing protein [Hyalangium versicolor]